jgi:hypothetical protein
MSISEIEHRAWEAHSAASNAASDTEYQRQRPCVLFRPSLSIDGNQWCALYGDNLQDGVAGFGDSPADAMRDFDANWCKPLAKDKP